MNDREYRSMEFRLLDNADEKYMVEGYASTFEPYALFTDTDGTVYYERIEPTAFDNADLTDVVFRIDHVGRVYARSSAGTVRVWPDKHGLAQRTNLGKTQAAIEVYADIAAGNYPKMSFAFTVARDHFDRATNTRVIDEIAKVYDVSPVSFPANPTTELSISTRDFFNGVIEAKKAERLERERRDNQRRKIKIMLEATK